jgi:hypothetical protein
VTALTPGEEMILKNPNANNHSVRSDQRRNSLDRFPLVGLAMILACAAVGYGILYYFFSLASW